MPSSSMAPMIALQSQEESQAPEISSGDAPGQGSWEISGSQSDNPSLASQATPAPAAPATGDEPAAGMNIQLTVNGSAFSAALLDNSASRGLYSQLPLTLAFEDYNSIEKIN